MRKAITLFFFIQFSSFCFFSYSQDINPYVQKAFNLYQKGELDSAKYVMDKHINDDDLITNGQAYYFRGFIYKRYWQKNDLENKESPYREVAYQSFIHSMELDTSIDNLTENINNLKYLGIRYFNDASDELNKENPNYNLVISCYNNYRKIMALVDTSKADLKKTEVNFYTALASSYANQYEKKARNISAESFYNLAKIYYNKVLEQDPDNQNAKYNIAILDANAG